MICPDRLWDPHGLLYRVCFTGVKWKERGFDHRPASDAEVKERVQLYVYFPSGPS